MIVYNCVYVSFWANWARYLSAGHWPLTPVEPLLHQGLVYHLYVFRYGVIIASGLKMVRRSVLVTRKAFSRGRTDHSTLHYIGTIYSGLSKVTSRSTMAVNTARAHPCPRAMSTAREHGRHFGHPCSRAVDTARGQCVPSLTLAVNFSTYDLGLQTWLRLGPVERRSEHRKLSYKHTQTHTACPSHYSDH